MLGNLKLIRDNVLSKIRSPIIFRRIFFQLHKMQEGEITKFPLYKNIVRVNISFFKDFAKILMLNLKP
jgi:hypothetical protein